MAAARDGTAGANGAGRSSGTNARRHGRIARALSVGGDRSRRRAPGSANAGIGAAQRSDPGRGATSADRSDGNDRHGKFTAQHRSSCRRGDSQWIQIAAAVAGSAIDWNGGLVMEDVSSLTGNLAGSSNGFHLPSKIAAIATQRHMRGIAIVGLGYWGPNWVRNFSQAAGIERVVCCDFSRERRDLIKSRYPSVLVTENLDQVLNDPKV